MFTYKMNSIQTPRLQLQFANYSVLQEFPGSIPGLLYVTASCRNIPDIYYMPNKIIKSVAYSSQGSHTGQLDFCSWLADGSTTG